MADNDHAGLFRQARIVKLHIDRQFVRRQPAGQNHQEGRGCHRQGDHRTEKACRLRLDQQRRLRRCEQHEAEFTALAEQQGHDHRRPAVEAEKATQPEHDRGLHKYQGGCQPEYQQRLFNDDIEIEHHANSKEEQAQQDRTERVDVRFQLVPIGRFGQHHARDKGTQCRRNTDRLHQRRAGADREQPGHDEQFALRNPADEAQQGREDIAAGKDQSDNGEHRINGERQPARRAFGCRCARQGSDNGQQGNDRNVLKQQDGEAFLTIIGLQAPTRLQQRQDLRS